VRKPFGTDCIELWSLSFGIGAQKPGNVNAAEFVDNNILTSMDGMSVSKTELDAQQFYQHLLVAGIVTIDVLTLFQYELCSYPTSLFDWKLLM